MTGCLEWRASEWWRGEGQEDFSRLCIDIDRECVEQVDRKVSFPNMWIISVEFESDVEREEEEGRMNSASQEEYLSIQVKRWIV